MKFFIAALGFCAIAAVSAVPAVVNTGHSAQFRSQDSLGNYAFGYNEDHATGGTFRRESGSPGAAEGSYGLRIADGRVRVVNYVADALGFRANIQTNEPGVEDQDPASVLINKAAAIVAPYIKTPVVAHAAPLAIQQSIEAPIVQQYEQAPIINAAPIVQKYESAPIIEQAPIVQQYEQAPIVQQYEQAPIVQQKYETGPLISTASYAAAPVAQVASYAAQAPIVQQYEQAPIIEQAPIVQAPLVASGYTTKTYAAPAPILSAPVAAAPISAAYGPAIGAYGPGPAAIGAYGPGPAAIGAYGAGPAIAAYGAEPAYGASYATKTVAPVGISSAALGLGPRLASPAFAAKGLTLGQLGQLPLIKKK